MSSAPSSPEPAVDLAPPTTPSPTSSASSTTTTSTLNNIPNNVSASTTPTNIIINNNNTTSTNHNTTNTSSGSSTINNGANIGSSSLKTSTTNSITGDDSQQFCLRWNNYQSNLLQVFEQLLKSESFVDVTLSCDDRSIKAHRMVLSACSPYFQSILKETDCSHPVIILQGVKWYELKGVVDFMYRGEINVSQDQLAGLLKTAESLKVRGLAEVGDGEEAEAVITSPSPRVRMQSFGSSEEVPRKRRRHASGDEELMRHDRNRSRSVSPPSQSSPLMAMEFLDTALDPILCHANMSRSSVSSQASSIGNGLPSAASPTALATSLSNLAAHLPQAMPPPPGHHMHGQLPPHLAHLPPLSPLSPLLNIPHPMARHHPPPEEFEIRPGIAEMIREEERRRRDLPDMAKFLESSHHWIGTSMADTYQAQVQAAWQKSWNQTQSLLQNLRFRERGPLKSWRPETMADAIHAVLKEGLSLSQAARKYDIPYPTFVLYANRVHNLLGPSNEPGDLRPKGRGRPQRILLGSWPEDQIKVVIRAVVFRDTSVFKDQEHKARLEQNKQNAAAAKAQMKMIKTEAPAQNTSGTTPGPASGPLSHMGSFKPGTPTSAATPDSSRSASTPNAFPRPPSQGPSPLGIPPNHMNLIPPQHGPLNRGPMPPHGMNPLCPPLHGLSPVDSKPLIAQLNQHGTNTNSQSIDGSQFEGINTNQENSSSSLQHSPHQSPAVSTPLPPPLSSPATPDTAVSLPPPSPSVVTPSPVSGAIPATSESPPAKSSVPSPRPSPPTDSPRCSPSDQSNMPPPYKGMQPAVPNGPCINGTSPNGNGQLMPQTLPFQQHLLQQQMMGGLIPGALPPNMAPPTNHTRMPHIPTPPYPGYMGPPIPPHTGQPRGIGHEESPEALLFNKIVGGAQFPPMSPRPFFQQEPNSQGPRNPAMMFHRDQSIDSIKSEPEPILN
uniref:Protein bric-a-brac 1-like n=2 Tax=Hirondellea gigas TaxID=1518452 RepID=A0A6A7G0H3_9CRUS